MSFLVHFLVFVTETLVHLFMRMCAVADVGIQ